MAKPKRTFVCGQCGAEHRQWQGQCADCGSWNSLTESIAPSDRSRRAQLAGQVDLSRLDEIAVDQVARIPTQLTEFDRVLGGGLVPGSVVLIGGDPGIGKSTLLLRVVASLAGQRPVCYVTGEESLDQIALRADRLGVRSAPVKLMAETRVETILASLADEPPAVLVVDSVQTLYSDSLQSAPGSVSQLRECAAQLVRVAKTRGIATILVGHVTDRALARQRRDDPQQ
ncbi:MAG: AAA family ATPase [Gammaproteobacteria bacterium]|nr:AAA family ATPase [Gammaproteobacteria bacterium]